MFRLFETIYDLEAGASSLVRRRYGVIHVAGGEFKQVNLRPFPTRDWALQSHWLGHWQHRFHAGDWCRLYYQQPRGFDNFLSLTYVVSGAQATFATFRRAVETFDRIGALKQVDALLCDAANQRISSRLLERWGWEPHAPMAFARNYIKRLRQPFSWQSYASNGM